MVAAFEPLNFHSIGDRLPPQNIEAEESILGGILIDPFALERVRHILKPEVFSLDAHQLIYKAILQVSDEGKIADTLTVMSKLADTGKLATVGGQSKLVQLVDRTVSSANVDQYGKLIVDKWLRRTIIYLTGEIRDRAYRNTPIDELIGELESLVQPLSGLRDLTVTDLKVTENELELKRLTKDIEEIEKIENPFNRKVAIRQLMKKWDVKSEKEFLDFHAKWLDSKRKERSVSLDEFFEQHGGKGARWLLDSWLPETGITVLYAKGGQGKTSLVGSLTKALIKGTEWSGYRVGKPINILWIQTDQGAEVTAQLLDRQGFFTLPDGTKIKLRVLKAWQIEQYHLLTEELKQHHFHLVVIDSLSSVTTNVVYSENDQEFARPLSRLRDIGERFKTSFLILHHSNHEGRLRGTTAIFNSADQVWKLERLQPKGEEQFPEGQEFANLQIQKSRFRQADRTYRVQFDTKDLSWFAIGEMLPGSEVPIPTTSPTQQKILDFLLRHEGVGYQAIELSELLNINTNSLRRCLNELLRDGLISTLRGNRRSSIYFCGDLHTSPPDQSDQSDQRDQSDQSDQRDQRDHEKISRSDRSVDQKDAESSETTVQQEILSDQSDQPSFDQIDQIDQQPPPKPKFKVGDRIISKASGMTGELIKLEGFEIWDRPNNEHRWCYECKFDDGHTGLVYEGNFSAPVQLNIEDAIGASEDVCWKIGEFFDGASVRYKSGEFFQGKYHKFPFATILEKHIICDRLSFTLELPGREKIRVDAEFLEVDNPYKIGKIEWKFGERVTNIAPINRAKSGNIIGKKGSQLTILWDEGNTTKEAFSSLKKLSASSDIHPFWRAFWMFMCLSKGAKVQALKHPDHKEQSCTNKVSTVTATKYEEGKFLAMTKELFIFNLEAVKEAK